MAFNYNKLWILISGMGISRTDLASRVGFTSATLAKLGKNQNVNMAVLDGICNELECNINDILEHQQDNKQNIRVASLFAGIGGFEVAFLKSNMKTNIVFVSEIDKHACSTYKKVFPDSVMNGDITKITTEDIPEHDLLVGGFPCQSFSIAGKRHGFEDTRGTLFFDIERILKAKKPKYILLENVKNLISHDNGNTIRTIVWALNELGYTIDFTVINSKEAGLAQSRERTYIIGINRHKIEPYDIDPRNSSINRLKDELNSKNFNGFNFFNKLRFTNKKMTISDILSTDQDEKYLFDNPKIRTFLSNHEPEDDSIKHHTIKKIFDLPRNVHNDNERQRRVYSINGISPTILARSDSTKIFFEENGRKIIRKLTPVEAFRAQGFDDTYIKKIVKNGVSNTQLYKQAGNAVSPPVVVGILDELNKFIQKEVI